MLSRTEQAITVSSCWSKKGLPLLRLLGVKRGKVLSTKASVQHPEPDAHALSTRLNAIDPTPREFVGGTVISSRVGNGNRAPVDPVLSSA
jgi:hypothetical protein